MSASTTADQPQSSLFRALHRYFTRNSFFHFSKSNTNPYFASTMYCGFLENTFSLRQHDSLWQTSTHNSGIWISISYVSRWPVLFFPSQILTVWFWYFIDYLLMWALSFLSSFVSFFTCVQHFCCSQPNSHHICIQYAMTLINDWLKTPMSQPGKQYARISYSHCVWF